MKRFLSIIISFVMIISVLSVGTAVNASGNLSVAKPMDTTGENTVSSDFTLGKLGSGSFLCCHREPAPPWMVQFSVQYGRYIFTDYICEGESGHGFYVTNNGKKLMLSEAFEQKLTDIDEVVSVIEKQTAVPERLIDTVVDTELAENLIKDRYNRDEKLEFVGTLYADCHLFYSVGSDLCEWMWDYTFDNYTVHINAGHTGNYEPEDIGLYVLIRGKEYNIYNLKEAFSMIPTGEIGFNDLIDVINSKNLPYSFTIERRKPGTPETTEPPEKNSETVKALTPTEPSETVTETVAKPTEPSETLIETVAKPTEPSETVTETVAKPTEPTETVTETVTEPKTTETETEAQSVTETVTESVTVPTINPESKLSQKLKDKIEAGENELRVWIFLRNCINATEIEKYVRENYGFNVIDKTNVDEYLRLYRAEVARRNKDNVDRFLDEKGSLIGKIYFSDSFLIADIKAEDALKIAESEFVTEVSFCEDSVIEIADPETEPEKDDTEIKKPKKTNTLSVKAVVKTVKLRDVKKKKVTVKNAITVTKNRGAVSYSIVKKGTSKGVSVSKKGVITIRKGAVKKKTTLKIVVNVTAKGNKYYKKAKKRVTVRIKVR